ncbi:MAG: PhoU domain-containing protein, partial [Candidatus Hydrothermarchaeota archaeon]|nr:PhoU domain-containing protein [Candidatus Hydrothermarchaeota archaeon]
LPKKWVKNAGLKRGDSVAVTAQEGSIIIEPGSVDRGMAEIEIKASQVPSTEALERLIIAYYLVGYDTIKVKLDRQNVLEYKEGIRKILDFLIGVEIVEDIGDSITIEIFLDHQKMQTTQVLKRIYLINKSMLADMIKAFENKDTRLAEDIILREREIDRLYFLVVRQLKSAVRYQQVAEKLGIIHQRDTLGYRIVVKSFERIADHIENIVKSYIQLNKIEREPKVEEFLQLAPKVLDTYETASATLFNREVGIVEEVFNGLGEIEKLHSKVLNQLFQRKINVQSSLLRKTMLDSISRISRYSADIAEIAINMSVRVP